MGKQLWKNTLQIWILSDQEINKCRARMKRDKNLTLKFSKKVFEAHLGFIACCSSQRLGQDMIPFYCRRIYRLILARNFISWECSFVAFTFFIDFYSYFKNKGNAIDFIWAISIVKDVEPGASILLLGSFFWRIAIIVG